ncbi:carbohydrate ABC transporter permease [Streptomyces sp. NBC_01429]|uniref:carbohydrate ABC transporter permease n=1 Tax=Streptomyces sp. NBC_01429 TaxID=2903862 RepID=UPI002E2DBD3D|nr:ABC transporter permease subunit [Streptomyces sp. NBC_01429]
MVIFLAGPKQLPKDVYEAAGVDGAGPFTRFRRIALPLTPIVFFNVILQTVGSVQTLTPAHVVSNGSGGPIGSTMLCSALMDERQPDPELTLTETTLTAPTQAPWPGPAPESAPESAGADGSAPGGR